VVERGIGHARPTAALRQKTDVAPEGAATPAPARARTEPALVKALTRAHRWQRMLDEGRYASISEVAEAERIDRGDFGRVLQLTLLAPDIVESILEERQLADLGLPKLLDAVPTDWSGQRQVLLGADSSR
jgi:hypothetical protein